MSVDLSKYSSIVVYGLGKSGVSCLKFLISQNYRNVFATDDNFESILSVKKILEGEGVNKDYIDSIFLRPNELSGKIDSSSRVIFAPGIPLYFPNRHPILDIAEDSCLVSDIEFFNEIFLENSSNFNIAVTGTNGKSTISSYIDYILRNLGVNSLLVGNIGEPIFEVSDKLLYESGKNHCLVTEVSSFQLDLLKNSRFDVAAISNITEDHIERHGNFENYVSSKLKIFKNSTKNDFLIINYDDLTLKSLYNEELLSKYRKSIVKTSLSEKLSEGVSIIENNLYINIFDFDLSYDISNIVLKGEHNKENYCIVISSILCYYKKIGLLTKELIDEIIEISLSFTGVRHRMQFLGEKYGIKFINDSKATNPISMDFALSAYKNIFLIIGGYDKGSDFSVASKSLSRVTKAFVIGKSVDKIESFLKKNDVKYEICFKLEDAFNKSVIDAKNSTDNDPVVMLSPGCASYDQWHNFEDRGDYFCKLFNELK